MRIQVAKNDLESALQIAKIGVASGDGDLSSHVLFRLKDGVVEVMASNGQRIFSSCPLICNVEGEEGDAFTVQGWRLDKWVGKVQDGKPLTLEFEPQGALVKAKSPRATITWASLDPSKFPYWDKTLSQAEKVADIESHRMLAAISYAKEFVGGDQETRIPALAAMEFRDGSLYATDQAAVTVITPKGLANSTLRIHGKDAPSLVHFLTHKDTTSVEVLEHPRCLILRRGDGALFGAAKWSHSFPNLKLDKDEVIDTYFEVKVDDLQAAIGLLSCAVKKGDLGVCYRYDKDTGMILLSVDSEAGGKDSISVECLSQNNIEELPDVGFSLSSAYTDKVISHSDEDTLRFEVQWNEKNGYVRFRHDKEGDDYLAIIVWLR